MRVFWVSVAVIGLYVIALATPACYLDSSMRGSAPVSNMFVPTARDRIFGVDALTSGWEKQGVIPECANIALALGWLLLLVYQYRLATGLGVIALVLGGTAPHVFQVSMSQLGIGFYLWMLSHASLAIGAAMCARSEKGEARKLLPG